MKALLLTIILAASSFFAEANMDCVWTSHKAGITISYVASCDSRNQATVDSIVDIVIKQLNRRDTGLKIFVLVNYRQLSFPGGNFANFFSIGFDTLRAIDDEYIFAFYWNEESLATSKNCGHNTFRSEQVPLDINATNNKEATGALGIKIIYDVDYRLGKPAWSDLIKAIVYAAQHPTLLEKEQRRDTVRYNTNGWYVSLSTIDTNTINEIIAGAGQEEIAETPAKAKYAYWLIGFIGLIAAGFAAFKFRKGRLQTT